jgi:hypothetical protein
MHSVRRHRRQLRYAVDMPRPLPIAVWSLENLRLPKALENDTKGAVVHSALRAHARKLWANGSIIVPSASWGQGLAAALDDVQREGRVVRGLEQLEKVLEREARGLSMADARSATERGSRVSRLVLVSNDGTERFYRQVERLVCTQGPRLLAICVDADSSQLAGVVPEASGVVRALMIEHKDSVVRVLMEMYGVRSHG